jgi:electron transfer flavoprotein alpha subunit
VDRVISYSEPPYRNDPEARVASLAKVHTALRPVHWLFADSRSGGGDLGRRLAARLRVPAATDVHRIDEDTVTRGAMGGRCDQVIAKAPILLLRQGALPPFTGPSHEGRRMDGPTVAAPTSRVVELVDDKVAPDAIALEEADFVISGGNGVRDWETFHELSRALGAAEGASRVAVDAGRMPRERQIGASGRAISARVYLAIGISGAPQHMQGIQRCEKVIAINSDRNCDMVKRSDIAVIADAGPIMKAMCNLSRLQHGTR